MEKKKYLLRVYFLDGRDAECVHTTKKECVTHMWIMFAHYDVHSCEVVKVD